MPYAGGCSVLNKDDDNNSQGFPLGKYIPRGKYSSHPLPHPKSYNNVFQSKSLKERVVIHEKKLTSNFKYTLLQRMVLKNYIKISLSVELIYYR